MHDPKFEQSVSKKMEELKLTPSASVWENVEKAVASPRRRRPAFVWWMLLPVGLLMGTGAILYFKSTTPHPATAAAPHQQAVSTPMTASASTRVSQPQSTQTTASTTIPAASSPAATSTSSTTSIPTTTSSSTKTSTSVTTSTPTITADASNFHHLEFTGAHIRPRIRKSVHTASVTGATNTVSTADADIVITTGTANTTNTTTAAARTPFRYSPGMVSLNLSAPHVKAADLPVHKTMISLDPKQTPKRPWEASFTLGGGISSPNQSLLHQISVVSPATNASSNANLLYSLANSSTAANSGNSPTNVASNAARSNSSKRYVSDIGSGLSFVAGISASKPLSPRWSLNLGLNLHYYSTKLLVGEKVDTYVPAYASLIASPSVAPVQTYPYYSAGSNESYTNRYYFFEIPATVQWRINNNHMLPLFWEGGAVLSYLASSDALYYNKGDGVYFKNASTINKTQLGLTTALLVGLPLKGIKLEAGPQVQYGLSSLLDTKVSTGQHLFYGGLKVTITPLKK